MKKIVLVAAIACLSNACMSQVNVSFDFSNVEQTIAFLKKTQVSPAEIDAFISTKGVQTIIKKIRSNDSIARLTLQKVITGTKTTGKENNFQYSFIKSRLQETEDFLNKIKSGQQVILDSIQSLSAYLPEGKTINIKVCFIAGGYSSGFTLDDDDVFYIGMHQYKNDFTGIVNTCQQELFHNIQVFSYQRSKDLKKLQDAKENQALYGYYLAQHLFVEGTAEYVADIDKYDQSSSYIKDHVAHAAVNDNRMPDNFYLIEKLIMDAYINTDRSDVDVAYSILYDWGWNNVGYAVGKYIARSLVNEYGPGVLKKYLIANPMIFIRDYIKLANKKKQDIPYNFSPVFEQMIDTVILKLNS